MWIAVIFALATVIPFRQKPSFRQGAPLLEQVMELDHRMTPLLELVMKLDHRMIARTEAPTPYALHRCRIDCNGP